MARGDAITRPGYGAGRTPANKGKTYPPTLLEPEEVQALLDNVGTGAIGLRGAALIGLLYRTGITVGEAVSLKLEDIDMTAGGENIHVHFGEHLAERTLALDAAAVTLLAPWWRFRRTIGGDHLLCAVEGETRGSKWHTSGVRLYLRGVRQRAGISVKRLHPHAFRASLLAELIIEQWPLPYVQRQLGVGSVRAVEKLLGHLGIEAPTDDEVAAVLRTREWTPRTASPSQGNLFGDG